MARRSSKEVLAEFHRLYDCFHEMSDAMWNHDGKFWTEGWGQHTVTRDRMLEGVAEKKCTPSDILAGVREALNDISEQLMHLLEDHPEQARDALVRYKKETGRDYWDDVGHPKKLVKSLLKRGKILDETEFRLLNAYVSDQAQSILTPKDVEEAQRMIDAFEASP